MPCFRRIFALILAVVSFTVVTAAQPAFAHTYPAGVKDAFVATCTNSCTGGKGSDNPQVKKLLEQHCKPTCDCSFNELSKRLTFAEFQQWNTLLSQKKPVPPAIKNKVTEALKACQPSISK